MRFDILPGLACNKLSVYMTKGGYVSPGEGKSKSWDPVPAPYT